MSNHSRKRAHHRRLDRLRLGQHGTSDAAVVLGLLDATDRLDQETTYDVLDNGLD